MCMVFACECGVCVLSLCMRMEFAFVHMHAVYACARVW